jgi:transcription-repair coupling factor (superfamily II helicase)
MSERELEDVILGFWEKDFDILVATTIIESGIDIPNANTLIVDRSDVFGLSQLHQLRGRVGRARERAYAYFLYPADKPLTEVAHDRLQTIAMNTDLGAGMQVALKDLEIRGAGNMLGGEQSGHIADVGFDLYMRMVGEAVAEFKSGVVPDDGEREDQTSIKVELPINAHLPEEYVDSDRLRLDLYRRLAEATSDSEVDALAAELLDRFGPPPAPAELLLSVAKLRIFAKSLKLREVIWMGKNLKLAPAKLPESMQIRVNRVYPGSIYKQSTAQLMVSTPSANPLSPAGNSAVSANGGDEEHAQDAQLLGWVHQVIRDLFVR